MGIVARDANSRMPPPRTPSPERLHRMLEFGKRILFVGYGAVAQCALPILMKHVKVSPKNVTVMDFEDRREVLKPWLKKGVCFERKKITRSNMASVLKKHLGA